MKLRIGLALLLAAALSSCSFDLSLPDRPQRGKVTGSVDTGGHISPSGLDVALVGEDGTRNTQQTDDTGAFVFGDLVPGVYYVDLALPGFAPFVRPNVKVKAGGTLELGALVPTWLQNTPLEATLSGKVVVAGGSGSPAGGQIEFILEGADQKVALAGVSETGEFVQRLPPGSYTLRVTHPLYVTATRSGITLAPAETKDLAGQELVLDVNPATVSGKILRERDGQAPVAANGATITPDVGAPTTTDPNGQYQLTGLAAGPRTVRVNLTGYHDAAGNHAITLQPGQSASLPDITLQLDRGAITGKVQMADLQPVRDTTLSVAGTPYGAVVSPDAADPSKGTFKISGVPVGTYDVIATKARYSKAVAGSITVTADGTVDVGTLTLTLLQGDFDIDDGDNTNTAGYTRTRSVTLKLNGFTGAATWRASEDPAFTNVPFVAFTGSSQPYTITGTGDGTKTVYAQYVDGSGTTSPTFSSSVVLDTAAPASPAIVINGGAGFTQSNQVLNVTLTATETPAPDVDAVSGLAKVKLAETAAGLASATAQTYARDSLFTRSTTSDGEQAIYAQFVDNAGNASAPVFSKIVVDTAAPSGSIGIARGAKATANGYTNSALVTLSETAAAEPNGGYVLIRLANSQADLATAVFTPLRSSGAWFIDPVGDGVKTVYAELQDAAGNSSGTITAAITYDTAAPSPATATLSGSSPVNSLSVTLNLNASDVNGLSPTEAVTLSEDPFFQSTATTTPIAYPTNAQVTFNPLSSSDGPKQLYVRFRDVAGNDALATVSFTLDRTPPSGSIAINGTLADGTASSTITSTSSVTVTLTQSGASSYQIGNESLTNCSTGTYTAIGPSTIPFTLSSSGQVRVCLKDAAGNATSTPLAGSITLDTAAPTNCSLSASGTRVNGQPAPSNLTAEPTIVAGLSCPNELPKEIVVGAGATALNCASTSLAWQPWTTSTQVTLPSSEGSYLVSACVRDTARNVATLTAVNMTLDQTPPNITSASIQGAAVTNATQVTVLYNATDANGLSSADGLTVSEDPFFVSSPTVGPLPYGSGSVTFPYSSGDGLKSIYLRLRDKVGNESTRLLTVTRDATPPSGSIVVQGTIADGSSSTTYTNTTAVKVLLTQSGASEYVLGDGTLDCATATGWAALNSATSLNDTLPGSGITRTVGLCLRDAAGNLSPLITDTIDFDATAPTGCAIALTGSRIGSGTLPPNKTATRTIGVAVTSCTDAALVYFTTGTVTCSATQTLPWQSNNNTATIDLNGLDGQYTVSGCAQDLAGNVSSISSSTMTLDTTAPTAASVQLDNGAQYVNASRGSYSATAKGVANGASEWTLSEDSTTFPAWSTFVTGTNDSRSFTFASATDGTKTLFAKFRDDVGNESVVVSDAITFDFQLPATPLLIYGGQAGGQNGFTNNVSYTVAVTGTATASVMYLVQRNVPGTCTSNDFNNATPLPATNLATILLTSTEGPKTVCAMLEDAAGNRSAGFGSSNVTLDTTPPTAPLIVTDPQTVNPYLVANPFPVDIAGPVSDTNFDHYEVVGGTGNSWTAQTPTPILASKLRFTFPLKSDSSADQGVPNFLRVRAVDKAGNAGPEGSVLITADEVPPIGVQLNTFWVQNGDNQATVYWQWPASKLKPRDLAGYAIYYGTTSGSAAPVSADGGVGAPSGYFGTNAAQGSSPVVVGDVSSFTLSGIPNGALTYVTIRPFDHAGNLGAPPNGSPQELTLQPNVISPNLINDLNLFGFAPGNRMPRRLLLNGSWAYAVGAVGTCPTAQLAIQPMDLSKLSSPVQNGQIQSTPAVVGLNPTVLGSTSDVPCNGLYSPSVDAVIDGQFLYASAGSTLRIYDLTTPSQPRLLTALDFSTLGSTTKLTAINALAMKGTTLFLAGSPAVVDAFDLSPLYGGSVPTLSNVIGGSTLSISPIDAMSVSRNRLIAFSATNNGRLVDITTAVDGDPATAWGGSMELPSGYLPLSNAPAHIGGNLMHVASSNGEVGTYDLTNFWGAGPTYPVVETSTSAYGATGQFAMSGSELFVGDQQGPGVRAFDVTGSSGLDESGLYRTAGGLSQAAELLYGPYLLSATTTGNLRVFEVATPTSPHTVAAAANSGPRMELGAGLAYTSSGTVFDLERNATPTALTSDVADTCTYDGVRFDDDLVTAGGGMIRTYDLRKQVDRDGSTTFSKSSDKDEINTAAGVRVTGLQAVGGFLVAAEVRTNGIWLEVFDASKVRDNSLTTKLSFADVRAQFQVATMAAPTNHLSASVTVSNGTALVMVNKTDPGSANPNPTTALYVVDLTPALDADPATTLSPSSVQGAVDLPSAVDGVIRGNRAYVTSMVSGTGTFYVIDISAATDGFPATRMPAGTAAVLSSYALDGASSVAVYGDYAFLTPALSGGPGIQILDLSGAAQGRLTPVATLASHPTSQTCGTAGDGLRTMRTSTLVAGTRMYVSSHNHVEVIELE